MYVAIALMVAVLLIGGIVGMMAGYMEIGAVILAAAALMTALAFLDKYLQRKKAVRLAKIGGTKRPAATPKA